MSVGYVLGDTSAFFAEGVSRILGHSQRLHLLGQANTPENVVALTRHHGPDVVVVGFEPPATSIEMARAVDVPVVAMSRLWQNEYLLDALDAGVRGFLHKDVSPEDLEHALLRVAAGDTVAQSGWQPIPIRQVPGDSVRRDILVDLTPREVEIVKLVVDGYSNKRMARVLGIAYQTAKNHVHNVMTKVGVTTRLQLRAWASDCGYVGSDGGPPLTDAPSELFQPPHSRSSVLSGGSTRR